MARKPTELQIGAELIALRFDWAALRLARDCWGDLDSIEFVSRATKNCDVDSLARLVEIAGTPKMSADTVIAASPPLLAVARGLSAALHAAFSGDGFRPEFEGDTGEEPRETDHPTGRVTGSPSPTGAPLKPESDPTDSGY